MFPPVCSCLSPFLWDHPASSSPSRDLGCVFAWWEESAWKWNEAAVVLRGEGSEGMETSARDESLGCCQLVSAVVCLLCLPLMARYLFCVTVTPYCLWLDQLFGSSCFMDLSCIWTMGLFSTTSTVIVVGRIYSYGAVQVIEIRKNPSDSLFRAVTLSIWC